MINQWVIVRSVSFIKNITWYVYSSAYYTDIFKFSMHIAFCMHIWHIWKRSRRCVKKFTNVKANFSRKQLSCWVTIAYSDSRKDIPARRYFFFFTFDGTISLIKDLGLIGNRGDCLIGRNSERWWTEQEEKDRARKRGEMSCGLLTTFDSA